MDAQICEGPEPLGGDEDTILRNVRLALKRDEREEKIAADLAEIASFVRYAKWWGPLLIGALLGDDFIAPALRAQAAERVAQVEGAP